MSVIGRLDDQVEAVLINPLKRERAPGAEERERSPAPAARDAETSPERETDSSPERPESDAALPVWML